MVLSAAEKAAQDAGNRAAAVAGSYSAAMASQQAQKNRQSTSIYVAAVVLGAQIAYNKFVANNAELINPYMIAAPIAAYVVIGTDIASPLISMLPLSLIPQAGVILSGAAGAVAQYVRGGMSVESADLQAIAVMGAVCGAGFYVGRQIAISMLNKSA